MPNLIFRKPSQRSAAAVSVCALLSSLAPIGASGPAQAAPLYPAASGVQASERPEVIPVEFVARRGRAVVGPRGGAAVRRTTVVGPRGNVVRNTAAVGRRGWARPGSYRWPAGGAIAAGAAIGFVTAATAVAVAGAAPAPGMCWYYTDPARTQGFWDYCPR
jgi:hypothetical protein